MIGNKKYNLIEIIGRDLLRNDKLPLLLLIAVLISAMLVVTTTHKTRRFTAEREQLVFEQNILNIEWRNLLLEENTLVDNRSIEQIATDQLHMQAVDPSQENILVTP